MFYNNSTFTSFDLSYSKFFFIPPFLHITLAWKSTGDQELDVHGLSRKGQAGRLVSAGTCRECAAKWEMEDTYRNTHQKSCYLSNTWSNFVQLEKCPCFATLLWLVLAKWTKPPRKFSYKTKTFRTQREKGGQGERGIPPSFRHAIKIISNLLFLFKTDQFMALSTAIQYVSCYGMSWMQQIKLGIRVTSHLYEAL